MLENTGRPAKPTRRKWILAAKLVVAAVVIFAVGRHVVHTWRDLHGQGRALHLHPGWLAVSILLYLAGLSVFGVFFWRILEASATPVGMLSALRAYLISHLGKYVPGKAMVVVVRAGLVAEAGARPATAAFATFYETLTMMAAGGVVAALGFALRPVPPIAINLGSGQGIPLPPLLLSLALAIPFWVVIWPGVFPLLSRWISLPIPGVGPEALPRFSGGLLVFGLACSAAGWILMGLSQVAVVWALDPGGVSLREWPLLMASVAMATVAGFVVAVLPGGLGVRELVIMTTLAPALGADLAVVAAFVLRLAWVIGEVAATLVLSPIRPPKSRSAES